MHWIHKIYTKEQLDALMRLPIFGWAFHILEFIPVERKWEADKSNMR
jgi:1-acyl-sn-glycerol-3-phosphate acyltransferase